jgi:hypothetical protein
MEQVRHHQAFASKQSWSRDPWQEGQEGLHPQVFLIMLFFLFAFVRSFVSGLVEKEKDETFLLSGSLFQSKHQPQGVFFSPTSLFFFHVLLAKKGSLVVVVFVSLRAVGKGDELSSNGHLPTVTFSFPVSVWWSNGLLVLHVVLGGLPTLLFHEGTNLGGSGWLSWIFENLILFFIFVF